MMTNPQQQMGQKRRRRRRRRRSQSNHAVVVGSRKFSVGTTVTFGLFWYYGCCCLSRLLPSDVIVEASSMTTAQDEQEYNLKRDIRSNPNQRRLRRRRRLNEEDNDRDLGLGLGLNQQQTTTSYESYVSSLDHDIFMFADPKSIQQKDTTTTTNAQSTSTTTTTPLTSSQPLLAKQQPPQTATVGTGVPIIHVSGSSATTTEVAKASPTSNPPPISTFSQQQQQQQLASPTSTVSNSQQSLSSSNYNYIGPPSSTTTTTAAYNTPALVVPNSLSGSGLTGSSSTTSTTLSQSGSEGEVQNPTSSSRTLNILALGGSITWGATLEDRLTAYPWLLGELLKESSEGTNYNVHVDNLAMRATGADFPSLCIESLVEEAGSSHRNYDLILMDFVKNGTNGLPLLLERLKKRYPNAVLVYVKLFSVMTNSVEAGTGKFVGQLGKDLKYDWVWRDGDVFNHGFNEDDCGREVCNSLEMETLVRSHGGYVYNFPRPASPKTCIQEGWFSSDWHHLSEHGHELLAKDLLRFLTVSNKREHVMDQHKVLGTWGEGDQCYNWFMSGKIPLTYRGGYMVDMLKPLPNDEKWVLSVGGSYKLEIEVESKYTHPVPLGVGYMSRMEPVTYPNATVTVNGDVSNEVVVDPSINRETSPDAHVTAFYHVGNATAGHNLLTITTPPLVEGDGLNPFRIVGIYLCGVCTEFGNMGTGAVNYAGHDHSSSSSTNTNNHYSSTPATTNGVPSASSTTGGNSGAASAMPQGTSGLGSA